jgi:hypothetical protein
MHILQDHAIAILRAHTISIAISTRRVMNVRYVEQSQTPLMQTLALRSAKSV